MSAVRGWNADAYHRISAASRGQFPIDGGDVRLNRVGGHVQLGGNQRPQLAAGAANHPLPVIAPHRQVHTLEILDRGQ